MANDKTSTTCDTSIDLVFSEIQRWIDQLRPLGYIGTALITTPDGDLMNSGGHSL